MSVCVSVNNLLLHEKFAFGMASIISDYNNTCMCVCNLLIFSLVHFSYVKLLSQTLIDSHRL